MKIDKDVYAVLIADLEQPVEPGKTAVSICPQRSVLQGKVHPINGHTNKIHVHICNVNDVGLCDVVILEGRYHLIGPAFAESSYKMVPHIIFIGHAEAYVCHCPALSILRGSARSNRNVFCGLLAGKYSYNAF